PVPADEGEGPGVNRAASPRRRNATVDHTASRVHSPIRRSRGGSTPAGASTTRRARAREDDSTGGRGAAGQLEPIRQVGAHPAPGRRRGPGRGFALCRGG